MAIKSERKYFLATTTTKARSSDSWFWGSLSLAPWFACHFSLQENNNIEQSTIFTSYAHFIVLLCRFFFSFLFACFFLYFFSWTDFMFSFTSRRRLRYMQKKSSSFTTNEEEREKKKISVSFTFASQRVYFFFSVNIKMNVVGICVP